MDRPQSTRAARPARATTVALLPPDEGLPSLALLFDREWVAQQWEDSAPVEARRPERIVCKQVLYRPGERAVMLYAAEFREGRWTLDSPFSIELIAGKQARAFHFPDDPYLPGLPVLADADRAQRVVPQYVQLHPQRLTIETVRYRPTRRAVLRYDSGFTPRRRSGMREASLFTRVMPPRRVARLLRAADLAQRSGFGLPRIVGVWPEGGAAWLAQVPGETLRSLIAKDRAPGGEAVLDGMEGLWATRPDGEARPFALSDAFDQTYRLLGQVLCDDPDAMERLTALRAELHGFVENWLPAAVAHNDFYDDQLVLAPDGRLFLVDFEEAAPGDPLLDVGNFLAHMRWMAHFREDGAAFAAYATDLRELAIERFGWQRNHLALRESFALLRLSTNPVRRLQRDWPARVKDGLALALNAVTA